MVICSRLYGGTGMWLWTGKIYARRVKNREILRDEMAVGRGVHRFLGVRIQKSRSNFRGFS